MSTTTDLTNMKLFAGCTRRQLRRVGQLSTRLHVPAGKVLTRRGDTGNDCVIICSGTVAITRDGHTVTTAGPGELIGEIACLDDTPDRRTATVHALTDCEVVVFSRYEFRRVCDELPHVAARIRRTGITRDARLLNRPEPADTTI